MTRLEMALKDIESILDRDPGSMLVFSVLVDEIKALQDMLDKKGETIKLLKWQISEMRLDIEDLNQELREYEGK